MKLPASILATLCAVGCEAYMPEPTYPLPSQTTPVYEIADPRLETIEPVEFAKPPGVAPVQTPLRHIVVPLPQLTPPITHSDPCPACGMG